MSERPKNRWAGPLRVVFALVLLGLVATIAPMSDLAPFMLTFRFRYF